MTAHLVAHFILRAGKLEFSHCGVHAVPAHQLAYVPGVVSLAVVDAEGHTYPAAVERLRAVRRFRPQHEWAFQVLDKQGS